MSPRFPTRPLLALTVGAAIGLFASCYSAPFTAGWYRCQNNDECGKNMVCDDGVCCDAEGTPMCPTLVRGNGLCPDGGTPETYFPDLDHDGFGTDNPGDRRMFCAPPSLGGYSTDAGDCLDQPNLGETSFPNGPELCDALDNDCDGVPDDGLDGGVYYQDGDNDGYGDPAVARVFCTKPSSGWVESNNDCDPSRNNVNPGAPEICDGIDNDCAGGVDNNPVGLASSCVAPGQKGICAEGKEICSGGQVVCTSTRLPKEETCNSVDDDCDGVVDNQPGCGGPKNLLATGVAVKGARRNTTATDPGFTSCQLGTTGWNTTGCSFGGNTWSGDGADMHMAYLDHPNTGTWDLTATGTKLHVSFSVSMVRQNATPWNLFGQPVILLCSKSASSCTRIRYNGNGAWMGGGGTYTDDIPLNASDNNWIKTQAGPLNDIERIEIYVMPRDNGTSIPHFDIVFNSLGFVIQ